jgi:hypothetical protein
MDNKRKEAQGLGMPWRKNTGMPRELKSGKQCGCLVSWGTTKKEPWLTNGSPDATNVL